MDSFGNLDISAVINALSSLFAAKSPSTETPVAFSEKKKNSTSICLEEMSAHDEAVRRQRNKK